MLRTVIFVCQSFERSDVMDVKGILRGESINLELKEALPEKSMKYMKTVVAFANGQGGKIIFGVQDGTNKIIGISKDRVFKTMNAITNAISDSCEPTIIPNVTLQTIENKTIIIVEISKGMQKPYYIKSMGMLEGTFIRVSGTTRHAERYLIQELILEGTNRSFDQQPAETTISEKEVEEFCQKLCSHGKKMCNTSGQRNMIYPLTKNQLISWKLLKEENNKLIPSNGYLLLSGSENVFPHAKIQCAVFKGKTRDIFITKKDYTGPIYQQIEDAYQFVLQNIRIGSRIEGVQRQDIYELPIGSIREMIANAVCHRSYLNSSNIQVALYDDRLEVTSPGMLHEELTIEQIKQGLSKIRNKGIAEAFSYMNIIEAWGSGIPRIIREAKEYGLREPELIEIGHDFRINLFRAKPVFDRYGVVDPRTRSDFRELSDTYDTENDTIDTNYDTETLLMQILEKNPYITQKKMAEKLGISLATVKRKLSKLQKEGEVLRKGSSRRGEWIVRKRDR